MLLVLGSQSRPTALQGYQHRHVSVQLHSKVCWFGQQVDSGRLLVHASDHAGVLVQNTSAALYLGQHARLASTNRVAIAGQNGTKVVSESGNTILRVGGHHALGITALQGVHMVGLAGELHYSGTSSVLAQSKEKIHMSGDHVSLGNRSGQRQRQQRFHSIEDSAHTVACE